MLNIELIFVKIWNFSQHGCLILNFFFWKDLMLVNNDYSYYLNVDIMSYATQNLKLINIFNVGPTTFQSGVLLLFGCTKLVLMVLYVKLCVFVL
jgi:hypothetical protein